MPTTSTNLLWIFRKGIDVYAPIKLCMLVQKEPFSICVNKVNGYLAGGVVASMLVATCLLWVGVEEVGFHPSGSILNIGSLPVALGLYGFCYAGHSVFPNIYSSMEKPAKFTSVLLIRCIFISSSIVEFNSSPVS